MGFNFRGLAFKQSMMILAAITVVFGLIFGIMSYKTQDMLNKMTVENGEETSRANVNYIDKLFNAGKLVGDDVAVQIGGLVQREGLLHVDFAVKLASNVSILALDVAFDDASIYHDELAGEGDVALHLAVYPNVAVGLYLANYLHACGDGTCLTFF